MTNPSISASLTSENVVDAHSFVLAVKPILIVDTEGAPLLTQVAVINLAGKPVYEATTPDFPTADTWKPNLCSRFELLSALTKVISGKTLVFHYAEHDLKVLRASYNKEGLAFPPIEFVCTYDLAKICFPQMGSYALGHLCQKLNLTIDGKRFDDHQAHSARYDALFTRQLYIKVREVREEKIESSLKRFTNPFGSSRVDNPFQSHPDFEGIYRVQFDILEEIIREIHLDPNHQSKGAVVIGEPGSGKTHLMMRLAQRLRSNRLFFIRQPNNANAVQYHIYSRILESLLENVPGSIFTQLEYLLANTLLHLVLKSDRTAAKFRETLETFKDNPLELFTKLGGDNTDRKRKNWQIIEQHTLTWWQETYSGAGSTYRVLQGFIKYCRYSDPRRRRLIMQWLAANELSEEELDNVGLTPWSENLSREEFALEAVSAIAKLSLLDEPLIIVFDQLEALFLEHNRQLLLNFGEAVKEIFTHAPNTLIILNLFPDRWELFQDIFDGSVVGRVSQHQIVLEHLDKEQLKQVLIQKAESTGCHLDDLFTDQEQTLILQGNSIRNIINRAGDYYRHKFKGVPLPPTLKLPEPSIPQSQEINGNSSDRLNETLVTIQNQLTRISEHLGIRFQPEIQAEMEELDLDLGSEDSRMEPETLARPSPSFIVVSNSNTTLSNEKLVIREYIQSKRQTLEKEYEKPRIISDYDDIGKFWDIAHAFQKCRANIDLDILTFGKRKLPDHVLCNVNDKKICIGFCNSDSSAFTSRIKNWNQLVVNHSGIQFKLYRDERQGMITGQVGKSEIEKLRNAKNGDFQILERSKRIEFDLISALVTDINNRDLEVEMSQCLNVLETELSNCFVFAIFG